MTFMKLGKAAVTLLIALSGALAAAPAFSHGGHVRFGVVIGGPYWYYPPPYAYYPPSYYYPPLVTVPAAPPVYIERNDAASERPASSYWYYCTDSKTYYPYVKECASPWQRVEPRPPNS